MNFAIEHQFGWCLIWITLRQDSYFDHFVVQIWSIFQILQLNFLKAIQMAIFFYQNNVVKTCHQKTEKKNTDPDSFCMVDYLL
jgi:hypothetical protein